MLACNGIHSWNNGESGSTNQIDIYDCSSWDESGPEYAYTFIPDVSGPVQVVLSGMLADLDIFVLDEAGGVCEATNCLSYENNTVTFDAQAGHTYYLVVDGYRGAVGDYTIAVTCGQPTTVYLPWVAKGHVSTPPRVWQFGRPYAYQSALDECTRSRGTSAAGRCSALWKR